jgi:hypothetical protein
MATITNLINRFTTPKVNKLETTSIQEELLIRLKGSEAGGTFGESIYVTTIFPVVLYGAGLNMNKTLFELAQFIVAQVDYYLFVKDNVNRASIVKLLHDKNAELFKRHIDFTDSEYEELVNDRVELYGKLLFEGHKQQNWANLTDCFARITLDTIKGKGPVCWNKINFLQADLVELLGFTSLAAKWVTAAMPLVTDAIDLDVKQLEEELSKAA